MPEWPLTTVISGGQTGGDQAGLRAGKLEGYETGGMVPKGWRTDEGPAPWLKDFGCVESVHESYEHRTRWNVRASDATLWFGRHYSPGHMLTKMACAHAEQGRPFLEFDQHHDNEGYGDIDAVVAWLIRHHVRTLNVAGNRERTNRGIGRYTENNLRLILKSHGRGASLGT